MNRLKKSVISGLVLVAIGEFFSNMPAPRDGKTGASASAERKTSAGFDFFRSTGFAGRSGSAAFPQLR